MAKAPRADQSDETRNSVSGNVRRRAPPKPPSSAVAKLRAKVRRRIGKKTGRGRQHLAAQVARVDRRYEALDLRRRGMSYRDIGRALQCSQVEAMRLVYDACGEIAQDEPRLVEKLRVIETEKLDELQRIALPLAYGHVPDRVVKDKDGKVAKVLRAAPDEVARIQLQAIDKLTRISQRRAKLWGLDAPVKIAMTDPSGEHRADSALTDAELDRLIAERELALGIRAIDVAPVPPKALTNGSGRHVDGGDDMVVSEDDGDGEA